VVVVGGRVAGALTAARLARDGLRILVLDSSEVTSGTISTHFFRGDGLVRSLAELDVLDEVLATGAPPLRAQRFYINGTANAERDAAQEPGDVGYCLSVRRGTLDPLLARRVAALPGVTWRGRRRVVDLLWDGDAVTGVRDVTGTEHRARLVVGADGRRSTIARIVCSPLEQHSDGSRFMGYLYLTGWRSPHGEPEAEFSVVDNEIAYVFPSDGGTACVALSVAAGRAPAQSGDGERWLRERLREHQAFGPRVETAQVAGRLVRSPPTADYVRRAAGPGWALVGDASAHQDPWSGFGMDTAARHAEALATAVAAHGVGTTSMAETYRAARDDATLARWMFTVQTGKDLSLLAG
jgi:menaquinone-9 beta-reductase